MNNDLLSVSDPWMTRREAAEYMKTTSGTLATLGYLNKGPKFFKPSPRKVLYRKSDLDTWISANEGVTGEESR